METVLSVATSRRLLASGRVGRELVPSTWACISFEMDSVARKLRMYKDGAVDPILSVDDHGNGCVAPTAVDSPW